ncbi:hypothetical protein CYPRO_1161 [Cyclonatronum proteinivorum]|uniref:SxtJ n=1 Tax=Cyclonatronum proteinivorum TaxID=1457365 RepID=A0A345UIX3_9BACT|nr:SxtJ family membrane protein [Cyclonatronum proteinivorum]AXJ00425.1 hypothetical protein CYPRO_1161 [Cyclonatronum proteinivorum]
MTKPTFIGGLLQEIEFSRKKIRDFGLVMLFIPGLLIPAVLSWLADWSITSAAAIFALTGIFLFVFTLVRPMALKGVYKGWMLLALLLALLTTKITISLVYFLVMTPIGLYRRYQNDDPISMKADSQKESYWVDRKEQRPTPESYEKQY